MSTLLSSYKILYVIGNSDVGGAGKMMKYLVNATSNSFSESILIEIFSSERHANIPSNVQVVSLNITPQGLLGFRIKSIVNIRKIIKEIRPDIVITFVNHECLLTLLASIGLKTIVCSAEREDPYSNKFPWNILYRFVYFFSDYGFFQLPLARDFYYKHKKDKGFVIPNAFISGKVGPYNGERKKTIVSAGRFVPDKRFELLIEAFSFISEQFPEYTLLIYGDGPCMESCKGKAKELGITSKVFFPGYIKNLAETIKEDGIFVLPSQFEGMPNSLMEALSTGIPCISTDCSPGGPRFLAGEKKGVLLVPVDDVKAMSEGIKSLICNPEKANYLSIHGPQILSEMSAEKIKILWLNAFEKIISKRNEKANRCSSY